MLNRCGLAPQTREQLDAYVRRVEETWDVRFEEGRTPGLRFMSHVWEDLNYLWKPLLVRLCCWPPRPPQRQACALLCQQDQIELQGLCSPASICKRFLAASRCCLFPWKSMPVTSWDARNLFALHVAGCCCWGTTGLLADQWRHSQVHLGAEAMGLATAVLLLALGFRMRRMQVCMPRQPRLHISWLAAC